MTMSRVTILVFITAASLVFAHSSHDEDKGKVQISVSPSHLQLSDESVALRKGMAEAGLDFDLDQKVLARTKLQQLSLEKKRVKEMADNLDRQMQEQYAALLGSEVDKVASLMGVAADGDGGSKTSEDEQFAQLEEQTNNIVHWFSQLKQLREDRDKVKAQKELAAKAASSVGLSLEEVHQELTSAATSEHRQHLASLMASSAIEMAQIESAAGNVMSGLDQLGEWKKRQDNSPESLAEASKVKAKLSDALNFLKEHEDIVEKRTDQINSMMKEANMGQL